MRQDDATSQLPNPAPPLSTTWMAHHKYFLFTALFLGFSGLIAGSSYVLLGHRLIALIYEGKSPLGPLNRLITGQAVHPVTHYYALANAKLTFLLAYLGILLAAFVGLYLLAQWKVAPLNLRILRIGVVALAFLASVAVRTPFLGRPPSDHHEHVTAQALIALQAWQVAGAYQYNFCIVQTFPRPADKFVTTHSTRIMDARGDGYYTSFPPLSIIAPYAVFKLFAIPITPLNLELFNVLTHLLGAVFIYMILACTCQARLAPVLGALIFLFLAPNLWFFGNVYSWDIYWHHLWILAVYVTLVAMKQPESGSMRYSFALMLGSISFLLTYAEYQGALYAASVFLWVLFQRGSSKSHWLLAVGVVAGSVLAIGLTVYQYSQIAGFGPFYEAVKTVAKKRSFLASVDPLAIIRHYRMGYSYLILPVLVLTILAARKKRLVVVVRENMFVLYLLLFPVVTHHIVMMEWTAIHDYSIVKSSAVIAVLTALLWSVVEATFGTRSIVPAFAGAMICAALFVATDRYRTFYTHSDSPRRFVELGRQIRERAAETEVVFALGKDVVGPQLMFESQRNIQAVGNRLEAEQWLRKHGRDHGRIFRFDEAYRLLDDEVVDVNSLDVSPAVQRAP